MTKLVSTATRRARGYRPPFVFSPSLRTLTLKVRRRPKRSRLWALYRRKARGRAARENSGQKRGTKSLARDGRRLAGLRVFGIVGTPRGDGAERGAEAAAGRGGRRRRIGRREGER